MADTGDMGNGEYAQQRSSWLSTSVAGHLSLTRPFGIIPRQQR